MCGQSNTNTFDFDFNNSLSKGLYMEKTVKSNDCSCPGCGATMRYDPGKRKLFCENCQKTKDILFEKLASKRSISDIEQRNQKTREWINETKNLKCPNCGANVVLNKLQYSSMCPYCNSNLVSRDDTDNAMAPDGIIPFTFSDEVASQKYVQGLKKKWFLPNSFKKAPPVDNIYGIYIPSFGFDSDTISNYSGRLATDHTRTDSKGRTHTYTTYENISGIHTSLQRDVLVESSSKIQQEQLSQLLPFNMPEAVAFNQGFIMGYTVEHYNDTVAYCMKSAEQIMGENIKQEILSKYSYDRVVSFNLATKHSNQKYMYYLLPVYKCDYKFKNKTYTTLMNGQTGKVGGGYPKSGVKIFFFTLMWILIVAGLILLFMYLGSQS